ncbi:hypothetical protein BO82DRAFT_107883 [Aspergillus uvarum CBS 121591]|uniref:Uncharacterized protein n=1 Tax=Aspergillus uvarum CBS 121591 TaxID=1448315 RepID=A0A319C9E9_9EURO|nr:hypothetical protein BO82DRAFT_107883 [Aspergillus uvarum CBS 121591]PYH80501.1 hypothetical protein BO82DRAFT_107883 [Aspergillus uvarum CBS 121591]
MIWISHTQAGWSRRSASIKEGYAARLGHKPGIIRLFPALLRPSMRGLPISILLHLSILPSSPRPFDPFFETIDNSELILALQ